MRNHLVGGGPTTKDASSKRASPYKASPAKKKKGGAATKPLADGMTKLDSRGITNPKGANDCWLIAVVAALQRIVRRLRTEQQQVPGPRKKTWNQPGSQTPESALKGLWQCITSTEDISQTAVDAAFRT